MSEVKEEQPHKPQQWGEGVVGKQARLEAGESFEATSWAMLCAPFGTMRGEYLARNARPYTSAVNSRLTVPLKTTD